MATDPKRVQEVFLAAVELPAAERAAMLERECGDDNELQQRVEALLLAHDEPGQFVTDADATLDSSPAEFEDAASAESDPQESAGSRIGPYKLLQKLGEGGMGTVYAAEQTKPVKRRVALKVIKPGMDSSRVIRRFEAERQALALMDHTNIAKVLDAGTTESGRPYFVMELVKGVPITKYTNELQLSIRQRLELVIPVCQAVQHAHQKGIVHRDIKPGNVLIAMQDGKPVPKVIDFGVAKALHQRLTDESMYTEIGQIIGTFEYMSPEQAELSALDVDTRADVYALGVLLYELLTGTTPLDRKRLRSAAFTEMLRMIKEQEPPRPSTRLTDSKDSLPSLAAQRHTDPARLTKEVRGDLDWIVMKCLEKDRTRRYETAAGLARDIERHLQNEPVEAYPPSSTYKFRKFARKHRKTLAAIAGFILLLAAGAVVSAVLAVRAWTAEQLAANRLVQVQGALKKSDLSRKQAEAVSGFLIEAFRSPDPFRKGRKITVEEVLDQAKKKLEITLRDQPAIRAGLLDALGQTYVGLGRAPEGVRLLREAVNLIERKFGPEDHRSLRFKGHLAWAVFRGGDIEKATKLCKETLSASRTRWKRGDSDSAVPILLYDLTSMHLLAGNNEEAVRLGEELLELQREFKGADHPDTAKAMLALARGLNNTGESSGALRKAQDAAKIFEEKLGPDHAETLIALNYAAQALGNSRQWNKALPQLEDVYRRVKKRFGSDHPESSMYAVSELSRGYFHTRQYGKVITTVKRELKQIEDYAGKDSTDAVYGLALLASACANSGDAEKAISHAVSALTRAKKKYGAGDSITQAVGRIFLLTHPFPVASDKTLSLNRQTLEQIEKLLGPDHHVTFLATMNLAMNYNQLKQPKDAEPVMRKAADRARRCLPADHMHVQTALIWLSNNQTELDKHKEAEPILRELLAIRKNANPKHWTTFNTKSMLGACLLAQKDFAGAEKLLLQGFEGLKQLEPHIPPAAKIRLIEATERLVRLYEGWQKKDEAARWRKSLAKIRRVYSSPK